MNISALTEYDTVLLVDRSGSMDDPAKGFASRWAQAQELTMSIAKLAAETDDDGITVIFFGGTFHPSDVKDGVKADAVYDLFASLKPAGSTPLGDALAAAFKKKFSSSKKAVVFVVTDGIPNDPAQAAEEIKKAAAKLTDASQLRVQFIQVGEDKNAEAYLKGLDSNLKGAKYDIVNTITFGEADGLTALNLYERAISDAH